MTELRNGTDIIIPARNEEFLQRTIDDILLKMRGDTEVIAILDGYWPDPGIKQHPKVTLIHYEEPIGQRAATNVGAKASTAKYIMKCDAHCMFDEGFDVKLMADCEYDWTVLPKMYTLNVFEWECTGCTRRFGQGPEPTAQCEDCGNDKYERIITYQPRFEKGGTEYMWFNSDLRVKYFDGPSLREFGDLKEMKTKHAHNRRDWSKEDITDVMCGVGAGWFLHRDRYWELGGLDEGHGSWGQMGVEIACKAWLSGGRHVVNKKTWFAHLFRTQGKGFSFPYKNPAKDQEKARKHSRKLWIGNEWPLQKLSIEWMINKFGPLPTWEHVDGDLVHGGQMPIQEEPNEHCKCNPSNEDACDCGFNSIGGPSACKCDDKDIRKISIIAESDITEGINGVTNSWREGAVINNVVVGTASCGTSYFDEDKKLYYLLLGHGTHYEIKGFVHLYDEVIDFGDALPGLVGYENVNQDYTCFACEHLMVDDFRCQNEKCPEFNKPDCICCHDCDELIEEAERAKKIAAWDKTKSGSAPAPPGEECSLDNSGDSIKGLIKKARLTADPHYNKKSIVYYTDNQCEERIANVCRHNLSEVCEIDQIICVSLYPISLSLYPTNFGSKNMVFPGERGVLTMFKQILAGLEASTADVVYMAEHDLLYHPSHFKFKPPRDDTFYYNEHTYKVRANDGQAVFYHTKQTSGLVAHRELLIEHYAKRIERVEKEGWNRRIGFEPGCHAFPRGIDNYKAESFMSEFPNIDIRHSDNLTSSRFKKEQFRSQRAIKGWKLVDEVPGWGVTKDRFDLFLREVMRYGVQTT